MLPSPILIPTLYETTPPSFHRNTLCAPHLLSLWRTLLVSAVAYDRFAYHGTNHGVLLHRPCKGLTRDTHIMASVLKSISSAIITTFDTIGDVGSAVQKSVGMATNYIDRQATSADIVGMDTIILSTTLELEKIAAELDGNAKRKALFDEVALRFKK